MRFLRAQGFLATTLGVLALSACSRPDLATDLRPEGDPEVLTVMILTDGFSEFGGVPEERATYCKIDNGVPDPKLPTIIGQPDQSVTQVCPETAAEVTDPDTMITEVTNANPFAFGGFHVRVVFDELLDPNIETLTDSEDVNEDGLANDPCTAISETCQGHIDTTLPVTLTCGGVAVPYDGYYVPNGNKVSWPPGPSIVVVPLDPSGLSGAQCEVSLRDNILDKEGNVVPAAQRGPYTFTVAELTIAGSSPADAEEITADSPVVISFTDLIDGASVDATDVVVHDDTADVDIVVTLTVVGTDIEILPTGGGGTWTNGSAYTVTIPDTATITDIGGGPYTGGEFILTFTVEP